MTIRHATVADRDVLQHMTRHFLASTSYGELVGYSAERIDTLIDFVLTSGVIFLAEREYPEIEAIGMLALIPLTSPMSETRYAEELAWWVEPESRSGTVGPQLLRQAEEWSRRHDLPLLKMVAPEGTDVGKFYARAGYLPVETAWVKKLGAN